MDTISVCIISKNEEDRISNCLSSVIEFADEIIVVDTGSTDNTIKIAKQFTNKVYRLKWNNDFSKARNHSFAKATSDWIMWLDCDDVITKENIEKIKSLKERLHESKCDAYSFWYQYRHNEQGECVYNFRRDRLLRRGSGHWEYPVHEALIIDGTIEDIEIAIKHTSNHDNGEKYIKFFEEKMEKEKYVLTQRDMYYYGGELSIFGQIDKSQSVFEKFFNLGEHDNQYEAKRAAEYLYEIYLQKEMYNEALEYQFKYMKYGYPDPKIYYKIGSTMAKLNRIEEALFYFKMALNNKDLFPQESYIKNEYNDIYFKCGLELVCTLFANNRIYEAVQYHKICKDINPEYSSVKFNDTFFRENYPIYYANVMNEDSNNN